MIKINSTFLLISVVFEREKLDKLENFGFDIENY